MLARKTVNWDVHKTDAYIGTAEKTEERSPEILLDMSAEMGVALGIATILIVYLGAFVYLSALQTEVGYKVVQTQQEIKVITKMNDRLGLEVAELKSPTRIQSIAQKDLGMVLPDAFVYSSKGATVEKEVPKTHPIVD